MYLHSLIQAAYDSSLISGDWVNYTTPNMVLLCSVHFQFIILQNNKKNKKFSCVFKGF